jgi:hypothetical protein
VKLDSVRGLKTELAETPRIDARLARAIRAEPTSRALAERMSRVHTRAVRSTSMALGIAAGARKGDYCLAARIQIPGRGGRALKARIERRARGECDVRIVPEVRKRAPSRRWFRARRRPLEAGLSVGHFAITAGTLGFIVEDEDGFYVLSNNHVLADVNRGQPGDPVVQPGPLDREPSPRTLIGVLDRFVPISFRRSNLVDCAVAEIFEDMEFFAGWTEALPGVVTGTARVGVDDLGRPVSKAGRTTGVTRGRITQVEVDRLRVDMGEPGRPELAQFSDQFEVQGEDGRFSDGGDSGSLIVDGRGKALGLLFAGGESDDGEDLTFANRIDRVVSKLGISLVLA